LTRAQFSDLPGRLPQLVFEPARDRETRIGHRLQAYRDFYGLGMEKAFPEVSHRIGRVNLAGFEIAVQYWLPPEPRGTLTIVHGYFDHAGLYGHAIRYGLERGLAVLAYDQPGHGLSSGERLVIESFDQYGDVLEQLLERSEALFPQPRYTLAQSMGGATALNHLWRYGGDRSGRIALCAPLLLPRAWGTGRWLHWLLRRWVRQVPRKMLDSSHDEDFNHFLTEEDGLQERHISVAWVTAMKDWHRRFLQLPMRDDRLLVVQGTGDGTVDWRYNLQQIQRKLPKTQVNMLEGAYHHLVNESDEYRTEVFAAIDRFFFPKAP